MAKKHAEGHPEHLKDEREEDFVTKEDVRTVAENIRIEKLECELENKDKEAKEYLDHLQRLQAEFANYRKRISRGNEQMIETASRRVIEALLPVLDNFELALRSVDEENAQPGFIEGIKLVYADLFEVLRKQGLEKIPADGELFDPQVHEAVFCEDTEIEEDDNRVADVMRDGYRIGEQVIRPTMVKVVKYRRS